MPKGGEALIGLSETVAVLSLVVAAVALVFNGLGQRRTANDHVVAEAERHARTDTKLDAIDATLNSVDRRLERMDERLTDLSKGHARLEGRVERLEARIGQLEKEFQDMNETVINEVAISENERKRSKE